MRSLGGRLDGVREKVERSAVRERESRRVIGRRLKILWGLLGFFVVLFLILAITRQWRRNETLIGDEIERTRTSIGNVSEKGKQQGNWERRSEGHRNDGDREPGGKVRVGLKEKRGMSSVVNADATLRLFDEL